MVEKRGISKNVVEIAKLLTRQLFLLFRPSDALSAEICFCLLQQQSEIKKTLENKPSQNLLFFSCKEKKTYCDDPNT